jgi:hypothetical protein
MRVLRKAHGEFAAYRIAGKPLRKNSIFVNLFSVYTHTRALERTSVANGVLTIAA